MTCTLDAHRNIVNNYTLWWQKHSAITIRTSITTVTEHQHPHQIWYINICIVLPLF